MSDPLHDPRFGAEAPFAIGLEEELLLVDAVSGELRNAREAVLGAVEEPARGEITGELHACHVELVTDVCTTPGDAVAVLRDLRRAVRDTGVGVLGSATHPTAAEDAAEISDHDRYRTVAALLGDAAVTPAGALHVHVGVPDAETAIRVFNGLRRHLPLLEALGANSPYRHGRDTGFASARELVLRAWARSGAPREMAGYDDFADYAARLTRAAGTADYTFHWWKLRPHPRLGTVEVRALDVQSDPVHTTALAALTQALAHHEAHAEPRPGPPPEILEEASYRAGRSGTDAALPDADGTLHPVPEVLEEALALARPSARALGTEADLAPVTDLAAAGGGAGLQRADDADGGLEAVLRGLLERSAR